MSLDDRARIAVRELRAAVPDTTNADLLRRIPERLEARRRARRAGLAVAVLLLVAALGGFALGRVAPGAVIQPADALSPTPTSPECGSTTVTCLGGRTYRVALPVPVTLTLPTSFVEDAVNDSGLNVEVYRETRTDTAGVTVMEAALPVLADGGPAAGIRLDSHPLATWLAARPFVLPAAVRPVSVGGLDGYRVDIVLKQGAALPAQKGGDPAALTFESDGWSSAVSQELLHSTYYLLDTPRGDVVVIWAWANGGEQLDTSATQQLLDGLSFG